MKHTMKHVFILMTTGLVVACGSDTGRHRTTFDFEVEAAGTDSVNEHGFRIHVDEAWVFVERIDFYEGEPLFSRVLRTLSPIQVAHAHPGHYAAGDTLGDVLNVGRLDLTGDVEFSSVGDGVTGHYRSARVRLVPDTAGDGHAVYIRGTAESEGQKVTFEAYLDETIDVTGVAFGAEVVETAGTISMQVDLSSWLRRADFSQLLDGVSQAPVLLETDHQPYNAFVRGVRNTAAFGFDWRDS